MNISENNQPAPAKRNRKKTLLTLLAIILILASALAAGGYIVKSTPKANRKKPIKEAPLVTTRTLESSVEQVTVSAMGTVIPAVELSLQTEVSGRIISVHKNFELGSRIAHGDKLLVLEPADYQLAVAQAESQLADAAYELAIEEGNQEIAVQEWELYDNKEAASEKDKELALRKPHLLKAQAEYNAARAGLAQAELDLQRTLLYAPFDALVTAKSAEPGGYLSAQETVATLVGTDRYWVQVSLPVDRLSWIAIPQQPGEKGSQVKVNSGEKWKIGTVVKLLGDLEEQGRMARLLVEVVDPLDLEKPAAKREPLLLGEYVRVEINGKRLGDVVSIPRSALRDGNRIWLIDQQQELQIATVDVLWRDSERVLLRNSLPQKMQLITSNLSSPVAGMPLRLAGQQESKHE